MYDISNISDVIVFLECINNTKYNVDHFIEYLRNFQERYIELELENEKLIDTMDDFRKVSQIIAMERENARLQNQINILNKSLEKYTKKAEEAEEQEEPCNVFIVDETSEFIVGNEQNEVVITNVDQDDPKPITTIDNSDEEQLEVYEKKIKDKIYYVDMSSKVYIKEDDNSIGRHVGDLIKKNNKTVISWITENASS